MSNFRNLLKYHNDLLERQEKSEDIVEEVQAYIERVISFSSQITGSRERDQLRAILRYWASYVFDETEVYPKTELAPAPTPPSYRWVLTIVSALFLIFIIIFLGGPCSTTHPTPTPTSSSTPIHTLIPMLTPTCTPTRRPTLTSTPTPRSLCYEFEFGQMEWRPETGNQAIRRVAQSTDWAKSGKGSLELEVELDGGDENLAQGEAFVDLRFNPPPGLEVSDPIDLEGIPVTIWVNAPEEAAGDLKKPNGVQVFAKDQDNRTEYGKWRNLTTRDDAEGWMAITLTPTSDPSEGVEMDLGFDPSRIILIGIKIAVGRGSTATYTGSIWIDEICWQMP